MMHRNFFNSVISEHDKHAFFKGPFVLMRISVALLRKQSK
jgi:hypothetical protein